MKSLIICFNFLEESKIFIGLCAACLAMQTFLLLNIPFSLNYILMVLLVGSCTSLAYKFAQLHYQFKGLLKNLFNAKNLFIPIDLIFILLAATCAITLNVKSLLILFHLTIIAFWYFLPLNFLGLSIKSLRQIPYLKVIVLAYLWTMLTFFLPLYQNDININVQNFVLYVDRFVYITILCLLFDIRDYAIDKNLGLITWPVKFGVKYCKVVIITLLFLINLIHVITWKSFYIIQFYFINSLILLTLIFLIDKYKNDKIFMNFIDGNMIVSFILLLFSKFLETSL